MTMVSIETDIEVSVEDAEGTSIDFRLEYSQGTVEVTLEGYTCSEDEIKMLGHLEREEIYNLGELSNLLNEPALTTDNVLEFIKKQPIEFKFNLVKELLKGK